MHLNHAGTSCLFPDNNHVCSQLVDAVDGCYVMTVATFADGVPFGIVKDAHQENTELQNNTIYH